MAAAAAAPVAAAQASCGGAATQQHIRAAQVPASRAPGGAVKPQRSALIAAAAAGSNAPGSSSSPAAPPPAAAEAGAAAGAAPPPACPARLQQEVGQLVALDVEYTHLQLLPSKRHVGLPAEVCLVDAQGRALLYEHLNPLDGGRLQGRRWRHVGGAPPALWEGAAPLAEVRARLAGLLAGRILVGHHLRKDLQALGLSHPAEACRDTLRYREMQGRRGGGRKLRDLSQEKLGRSIQGSRRHSPREDAQAALDLYLRHLHFEPRYWRYEDMVDVHLADILATASASSGSSSLDEGAPPEAGLDGGG